MCRRSQSPPESALQSVEIHRIGFYSWKRPFHFVLNGSYCVLRAVFPACISAHSRKPFRKFIQPPVAAVAGRPASALAGGKCCTRKQPTARRSSQQGTPSMSSATTRRVSVTGMHSRRVRYYSFSNVAFGIDESYWHQLSVSVDILVEFVPNKTLNRLYSHSIYF